MNSANGTAIPWLQTLRIELREILRDTLKQLHPRLRAVFVLRDIEGLSVQQTAEALNLTLVAVKARSWRARSQLRERLSKHFRSNDGQESAGMQSDSSLSETPEKGSKLNAPFLQTRFFTSCKHLLTNK